MFNDMPTKYFIAFVLISFVAFGLGWKNSASDHVNVSVNFNNCTFPVEVPIENLMTSTLFDKEAQQSLMKMMYGKGIIEYLENKEK